MRDPNLNSEQKRVEMLFSACERGDVGQVEALLSQDMDVNAVVDEFGRSPLLVSCLADQPAVTKQLVAHSSDIHRQSGDGCWKTSPTATGFYHIPLPAGAAPLHAAACVGSGGVVDCGHLVGATDLCVNSRCRG